MEICKGRRVRLSGPQTNEEIQVEFYWNRFLHECNWLNCLSSLTNEEINITCLLSYKPINIVQRKWIISAIITLKPKKFWIGRKLLTILLLDTVVYSWEEFSARPKGKKITGFGEKNVQLTVNWPKPSVDSGVFYSFCRIRLLKFIDPVLRATIEKLTWWYILPYILRVWKFWLWPYLLNFSTVHFHWFAQWKSRLRIRTFLKGWIQNVLKGTLIRSKFAQI
jgi:hypothetical protein